MDINEVFKALSNPTRMIMLQWLKEPKKHFDVSEQLVDADEEGVCVSIIQAKTELSQSTVSIYLAALQRAELVSSKRIGPWTYYKRNEAKVQEFLRSLEKQL